MAIIDKPLSLSAADPLSAENFVRIRSIYGGPAPDEAKKALAEQREAQATNNAWLLERRSKLTQASELLAARIELALLQDFSLPRFDQSPPAAK